MAARSRGSCYTVQIEGINKARVSMLEFQVERAGLNGD